MFIIKMIFHIGTLVALLSMLFGFIFILFVMYNRKLHEIKEQKRRILCYEKDSEERENKEKCSLCKREIEYNLKKSIIYSKFHDITFSPTRNDFYSLEEALDYAYDNFTLRIKKLCPTINEMELIICCLVKIGIQPKEICIFTNYKYNTLNMKKCRLYMKLHGINGSASMFDCFIAEF